MATIKAIESRSVHQIQSGQVIVDLVSVVKELVENSLDAGATSIEVRFKNHGLESIEVQDNGNGIAPEDFETIALKHYTSKLTTYEDLNALNTFGFRGEALSSLCALSKFNVVTARAEDGAVGKKLDFETSGQLKGSSVVAAQRGTTVSVENLFSNLPVRRKELEKNLKREYAKVISHLYAYACISVGVRFSVSNQVAKGKKVPVFSTKANATTRENVANVFGAKTLSALVQLDLQLEMEPSNGPSTQSARTWSTQARDRSTQVQIQGHISKPVFGEGRQAPDRQMFFVNSRPCGLPQIAKAVNEVYKAFNVSQSPFVFANLIMDTNAYDVNVSPDKRTIMLHDQTALLEALKTSLTELFESTEHTMPQSQLYNRKLPSYKPLSVTRPPEHLDAEVVDTKSDEEESEGTDGDEEESALIDSAVSVRSRPPAGTPVSLTRKWAERDTAMRRETPVSKQRPHGSALSKFAAEGVEWAANNREPSRDDGEANGSHSRLGKPSSTTEEEGPVIEPGLRARHQAIGEEDPMGSPFGDLFSQRAQPLPKRVQDFNTLMTRSHESKTIEGDADNSVGTIEYAEGDQTPSAIPAELPGFQKASAGPIQSAFDRMRPVRTPLQTAEITIGDTTTTTTIGSGPPFKKRRIHQPVYSQSIAQFAGSPLLTRGLRNFAAPGSQLESDSSNIATGDDQTRESDDDEPEPLSSDEEGPERRRQHTTAEDVAGEEALLTSDAPSSGLLDDPLLGPADDHEHDDDYIDEDEKKMREDEMVARLIQDAELAAAQPNEYNLRRASQVLKNTGNRKESTLKLTQYLTITTDDIREELTRRRDCEDNDAMTNGLGTEQSNTVVKDAIDDANAESRLSLTVSKADFGQMRIIGQFNLGFVLAVRPSTTQHTEDELFIIDQHAADEKYNYERLYRTVTLQSQRLVRPKVLELTAVEEEIIMDNADALKANGFEIETHSSFTEEDEANGHRCRLVTLPMSKEKTFELSDLEELLHLLSEAPAGSSEIPRPRKVQRMLAMRACRSSIMVGKTLTTKQMGKVVRHMGEMEKPWNCPHGRPTMRHLAGLGAWKSWQESDARASDDEHGDADVDARLRLDGRTDWKAYLERRKAS